MHILRSLAAMAALCILAACANDVAPSQLPQLHLSKVTVQAGPTATPDSALVETTKAAGQQYAAVYSREIPPGAPTRELVIRIDDVHYKNAVTSLIVGDTNRISGVAAVVNAQGQAERSGEVVFVDTGAAVINGIAGAVLAAGADKSKVDQTLAIGMAERSVAFAYGQKQTPNFIFQILRGDRNPTYPPYRGPAAAVAAQGEPATPSS